MSTGIILNKSHIRGTIQIARMNILVYITSIILNRPHIIRSTIHISRMIKYIGVQVFFTATFDLISGFAVQLYTLSTGIYISLECKCIKVIHVYHSAETTLTDKSRVCLVHWIVRLLDFYLEILVDHLLLFSAFHQMYKLL